MKRNPSSREPQRNDYDPLDPGSAYYTAGRQEEDLPDFIPAGEPLPEEEPFSSARPKARRQTRRKQPSGKKIIWTLVSLGAIILLLNLFVFRIRHVRVEGYGRHDPNEIVRMAGLDKSVSYFGLNRADVEAALMSDRYLKVVGFEKRFPSTLILTVRERGLCANVQFNSVWYMVDEDGFVLERLGQETPRNTLLTVNGMQVRDARIGSKMIPAREDQLNAYCLVMKELLNQGYANAIAEIYVGDPKTVTLLTRNGFTVHLGSAEDKLMAKIAVTRGVAAKLVELGKESGSIDVTDVSEAIYSP